VLTNEQSAKQGAQEAERKKQLYVDAIRAYNAAATSGNTSVAVQRELLDRMYEAATATFTAVDQAVSESDLLGANRSEAWAIDLAATAVNTLHNIAKLYGRVWEEADHLQSSRPYPSPTAFYSMQSSASRYFPAQARILRSKFQSLGLPVGGFDRPLRVNTRYKDWQKIVMAVTAIAFLLILIAIGVFMRPQDLNDFNIFLFRTVLALIAGAFGGVFIPGVIQVEKKGAKFAVTAAGAAAFVVIVYFFNPPALVKNTVQTIPSPSPAASAHP
jgi:hypothetical protein